MQTFLIAAVIWVILAFIVELSTNPSPLLEFPVIIGWLILAFLMVLVLFCCGDFREVKRQLWGST